MERNTVRTMSSKMKYDGCLPGWTQNSKKNRSVTDRESSQLSVLDYTATANLKMYALHSTSLVRGDILFCKGKVTISANREDERTHFTFPKCSGHDYKAFVI